MDEDFIGQSLRRLAAPGEVTQADTLKTLQRTFLRHPERAAALARRIAATPAEEAGNELGEEAGDELGEEALTLLSGVLDEARMAQENDLPEGDALLAAVEGELERLAGDGALPPPVRLGLAQAWVRAGLETPAAVTLDDAAIAAASATAEEAAREAEMPDLGALIDEVRSVAGGEPLQLHAGLVELLAALPAPMRAVAVGQIARRPEGNVARLGAYWLLDRTPEVRAAAAAVALERARDGGMEAGERARLVTVRKWLPADETRGVVDRALREALRRGVEAEASPPAWRLHRIAASLPDGVGAQYLAVAAQQGGRRAVALALVKAGHGVKDAHVIPCKSTAEQRRTMDEIAGPTGALDVDAEFARDLLARALAEGVAAGLLPAPGLVDVAEIIGGELTPTEGDTAALLAALDHEGHLAVQSAQRRGRRVNASADWPGTYPMIDSWFEDTGAVREILDAPAAPQRRRAALKRHLDTRRDWWAAILARAAATLKAAGPKAGNWRNFWTTAAAVQAGRDLDKTPIMRAILERTLDAADARDTVGMEDGDDDTEEEAPDDPGYELAWDDGRPVPPEEPGELAALLAGTGRTPAWIDGWLTALAVAPYQASPERWTNPLLEGMGVQRRSGFHRYMELLSLRSHAIDTETADAAAVKARLGAYDAQARREWAEGFGAFVLAVREAWGKGGPDKENAKVIALIGEAATRTLDDSHLALVSDWIARCHAKRR